MSHSEQTPTNVPAREAPEILHPASVGTALNEGAVSEVAEDEATVMGEAGPGPVPIRLGAYQVRALLARGSMGVVYEAFDPGLHRPVAVKVLPAEACRDVRWMERLATEARTLATINHTNVAAIHGLERDGPGGAAMLVLEFVPGPTLRELLLDRRLGVEEALRIGVQVASGLEAAHEKGVIHRDLKPDNIKVTPAGVAKILDFGISLRGDDGLADADAWPELSGTHGYISPEQYRGLQADRRADIFAFGCLLFECLSGKPCFRGIAAEEIMLETLDDEPDWLLLPARTPRRVQELLAKCLQKDPLRRLRDIGDARLDLELAIGQREWAAAREVVRGAMPAMLVVGSLAAGGLLTAGAMKWGGADPFVSRPTAPINVVISEPGVAVCGSMYNTGLLAIAPDGRRVVYGSPGAGAAGNRLMLWESDGGGAHEIPSHGVNNYDPCFSPDGKDVCFVGPGILRTTGPRVPPSVVWDGNTVMKGMAWFAGAIICSPHSTGGLVSVPIDGRHPPISLTMPDFLNGELSHRYPDPLPDGRNVLFTLKRRDTNTFDDADICVLDLRTGTWRRVLRGGTFARWSPTGHLLYVSGGTIFSAPFDLRTCTVTGPREPVVEGVMYEPASGAAQFALARESGTLAYIPGGAAESSKELCWLSRGGGVEPLGAPVRDYLECVPSPDGERIAVIVSGASDAMFVHEVGRGVLTRLTFGGNAIAPAWEPDSNHLVYASDASGAWALYQVNSDGGGGAPQRIADLAAAPDRADLRSADGKVHVVLGMHGDIFRLCASDPPGDRVVVPLMNTPAYERAPALSPDGRWLAYSSDESGSRQVYIRPFPSAEGPDLRVTDDGGDNPRWSPDGRKLMFERLNEAGRTTLFWMNAADLVTGKAPEPGLYLSVPADVSATTQLGLGDDRVLALRHLPPTYRADRVCLILNFLEQLRQRAGRTTAE